MTTLSRSAKQYWHWASQAHAIARERDPVNSAPGRQTEGAAAGIPEGFVDRSLERYQSMPALMRALVLVATSAGVALSVVYIFGLAPLLDVTYYFLLMAAFLPMAFLFLPTYRGEGGVGRFSYVPAAVTLGLTLFLAWKSSDLVYQTWVPVAETWH